MSEAPEIRRTAAPRCILGLPLRVAAAYALMFAIALGAYSVLWKQAPVLRPDSSGYLAVARDLSDSHLEQLHDRTPGYPLLLLAAGASQQPRRSLFVVSLLLHAASVWLIGAVLHISGVRGGPLVLFALLFLLRLYVEPAAYVLTDNLTQFLLVAGFASLVFGLARRNTLFLLISGFAFGYCGITRPTYQAIAIILPPILLGLKWVFPWLRLPFRQMAAASLALWFGAAVFVGGMILHNYVRFHYAGLTPLSGLAWSTKTARVVERLPERYSNYREVLVKHRDAGIVKPGSSHTGMSYLLDGALQELQEKTGLDRVELSRRLKDLYWLLIRENPLEYALEVFYALSRYWMPAAGRVASMNSAALQAFWAAMHFGVVFLALAQLVVLGGTKLFLLSRGLSGGAAALAGIRVRQELVLGYGLALGIVLYTMLVSCLVADGASRYRVPSDVFIVFILFAGAHLWCESLRPPGPAVERS